MKQDQIRLQAFRQAVNILPARLKKSALAIRQEYQTGCEEIRLRAGRPMSYSIRGIETPLANELVSEEDLQEALSRATRYSVHSFGESLASGFVTLEGGHRLGLCGTAVLKSGKIEGMRALSSLNLRIASQVIGAADEIAQHIYDGRRVWSTLIVSPPAWGKTTLLRDLVRVISEKGVRMAIADERCEIAGVSGGAPQFDIGPMSDVLSGAPKAQAAMQLLKTMSPGALVLDEVTAPEDVLAVTYAAHCGAAVLATAHALDFAELKKRSLYIQLLESNVFERIAEIHVEDGVRSYRILDSGGNRIC